MGQNFLGTCDATLNTNFLRLDNAITALLASAPIQAQQAPPGIAITPVCGFYYGANAALNQNWEIFDIVLGGGTTTRQLRFTSDEALNRNFRKAAQTLITFGHPIPVPQLEDS